MDEKEKIKNLLERNVVELIEKDHLQKKLEAGKKLRIKLGIDPTGPNLHLGRAVALRKLKEFQDLGHQIILIIGDFTALVGDASDKESERPQLTKEQIRENMKGYKEQIGKILNIKKVEFKYNGKWFKKLKFAEVIKLASLFTVHQLINRRNFKERFETSNIIGSHEFLYPWMQGYDSVMIKADVEIGGTDQLFNLKAGRKLQELYKQKPQDIMTLEMLEGTDGRKMATSEGNVINIMDEPTDMFGKIMSMKDEMIVSYFILATDKSLEEIEQIKNKDPMNAKKELAYEVVKLYHSEKEAGRAQNNFEKTFQKKELPEDIENFKIEKGGEFKEILLSNNIVSSTSELRRLINSGAIEFEGEVIKDVHYKIEKPGVVRVGKKKFVKLIF